MKRKIANKNNKNGSTKKNIDWYNILEIVKNT